MLPSADGDAHSHAHRSHRLATVETVCTQLDEELAAAVRDLAFLTYDSSSSSEGDTSDDEAAAHAQIAALPTQNEKNTAPTRCDALLLVSGAVENYEALSPAGAADVPSQPCATLPLPPTARPRPATY